MNFTVSEKFVKIFTNIIRIAKIFFAIAASAPESPLQNAPFSASIAKKKYFSLLLIKEHPQPYNPYFWGYHHHATSLQPCYDVIRLFCYVIVTVLCHNHDLASEEQKTSPNFAKFC